MKIQCDVIMDLLPLYYDGVCNENSSKLVEEHLSECVSCKNVLDKMKNNAVETILKNEREDVVRHHAQTVKRKSLVLGISIASVMAVPILVSMIVNLATGRALDWFFIVLTSLMTLASVTVVPLVFEKEKGLWTLGSFTACLSLLLLTCAIYSGGNWFFVVIIPVLFGLSVLFAPYVISRLPLTGFVSQHKGTLTMAIDTVLLYAIIFVCGFYVQNVTWSGYWQPAFLITTVCLIFPWGLFLMIRYIKADPYVKAGLCVIFGGLFGSTLDNFIHLILEGVMQFRFGDINLYVWSNNRIIDANVFLLTLLTGLIVGGILLAIGMSRIKKR